MSAGGTAGFGGAGVSGSNLIITNIGTIAGGLANAGTTGAARADAIDFTNGTNSLTLSQNGTTGTLTGGLGVGGTLSIDPGTTAGANGTLANLIHDYSATAKGTIVKVGTGTLTLSGANTYTGGTSVMAGQLNVGNASALGATTNTLAVSGGTLDLGAFTVTQNGGLTLTGGVVQDGTISSSGGFSLQAGTVSAVLTGSGAAIKSTAGTVVLSGANTYSGGTTLVAGTLELGQITSAGSGGIAFTTGAQTLRLDTNGAYTNNITNFATDGDTIDVRGIANAKASFDGATHVLTLTGQPGTATTTLNLSGTYTAADIFTVTADGKGGSNVTLSHLVPPSAPTNLSLDSSTDSGTQGDDVTSVTKVTIDGNALAGSTVTLYDGVNAIGTATATGAGLFQVTATTALVEGANNLTATASNAAGTSPASSSALVVTLDTTAPGAPTVALASDTGPSPTDGITSKPALTVTQAESGGTLIYSADGGTTYTATAPVFATDGTADGPHAVSVEQQDAAGNVSAPGSITFTLDDTKPTVAITSPGGDVTSASQTISGSVMDANPGATVSLYDNGSSTAFATATLQNGAWSTTVTLAPGQNSITAQDTDLAGNTGTSAAVAYTYAPPSSGGGGTITPTPAPVTPATITPTPAPMSPAPVAPNPAPTPVGSTPITPAPTPVTGSPTNNSPAATPADTVSIDPDVSYADGAFTLTGRASSAMGVTGVEISALLDDGARQDLGAATVNGDGTWTFTDPVGTAMQSFLTATVTDGAGASVTSADPGFSLQGGLMGHTVARQDSYSADGSAIVASSLFRADGSRRVEVQAGGQTFQSGFFDTFQNGEAPDNTFVFDPGHGLGVVSGFRIDGTDHDTISLLGSDFGDSIAEVLRNTRNAGGSAVITDPTSGDTIRLAGITKAELKANRGDFAFHG